MPKTWSTADVHPRDRAAYWADAVCDSFIKLDCEPQRGHEFSGEIVCEAAGELQISTVSSMAQTVTRSPRHIARDPAEVVQVTVQLSGYGILSQDGREALLRPGDFALHDSTRSWQLTFDGDFAQTVLLMPRSALRHRIGASERVTATRIDGTNGLGGVLSPMLQNLPLCLATFPTETRERLAENLLDILSTAILSTSTEKVTVPARLTLARAKLWIETHLDEDLSAERIAGSCRLSSRHLSRLFEREGTSLMRYVWERRLVHCHRNLTDPAMRVRTVSEQRTPANSKGTRQNLRP